MEQYDLHKRFLCAHLQFHTQLQGPMVARRRQYWILIQQIEAHEPNLRKNPPGRIAAALTISYFSLFHFDHDRPFLISIVTSSDKIPPPLMTHFYSHARFNTFSELASFKEKVLAENIFYISDLTFSAYQVKGSATIFNPLP